MTINRILINSRLTGAVNFGELIFLSDQVPSDAIDLADQTRQVLEKIDALLAEADSDKDHLLSANLPEAYRRGFRSDELNLVGVMVAWPCNKSHHLAGRNGAPVSAGGNSYHRGSPLNHDSPTTENNNAKNLVDRMHPWPIAGFPGSGGRHIAGAYLEQDRKRK